MFNPQTFEQVLRCMRWILSALLAIICQISFAKKIPPTPRITPEQQKKVVLAFLDTLDHYYIFQDTAMLLQQNLSREPIFRNKFYRPYSIPEFTQELNNMIHVFSHDLRLGVRFAPEFTNSNLKSNTQQTPHSESTEPQPVVCLGYPIELSFASPQIAVLTINEFKDDSSFYQLTDSFFNELKNTQALIIDLRQCHQGSIPAVNYVLSYVLQAESPLCSVFRLEKRKMIEDRYFTADKVNGTRYNIAPIYVITGRKTGSAAERFCYELQTFKRATVVGVQTTGSSEFVKDFNLGMGITASIPLAFSKHPRTGTSWEGIGIKPDIVVKEDSAMDKSIELAKSSKQ